MAKWIARPGRNGDGHRYLFIPLLRSVQRRDRPERPRRVADDARGTATCASIASPALEQQYALIPAAGCTALRLAVRMIDPPTRIRRAACLTVSSGPSRLTSITRIQSAASASVI